MADLTRARLSGPDSSAPLSEVPEWILRLTESLSCLVAYVALFPEVKVLYVNSTGRSMLGLPRSSGNGNRNGRLAAQELSNDWLPATAVSAVIAQEVWQDTVYERNRETGQAITLERHVYPVSLHGDATAACVVANDMSEAATNRRNSEVLRSVIDHIPNPVTIFSPDDSMEVVYANTASLDYNGVKSLSALTEKLHSQSSSADKKMTSHFRSEIVPRVLNGEQVEYESEIFNAKTSDSVPVQRTVFPVWSDTEDRAVAIGSISTNIERISGRAQRAESQLVQQDVLIGTVRDMYSDEKRRAEYLEQVQVIASHAASQMDVQEMLNYVAHATLEAFDYYVVAIHLFDRGKGRLVTRALSGKGDDRPDREPAVGKVLDETRSAAGWVASLGEELLVEDSQSQQYEPIKGWPDTKSQLLVPIIHSSKVHGVLDLHGNRPGQLDSIDQSAARIIAGQIAVGLEMAKLIEQSREQTLLQERSRLAREMHDSLVQKLASVHWQVSALTMDAESEDIADELVQKIASISSMVQEALDEVRRSVWDLGADELEKSSLAEALERLVSNISQDSGIEGEFHFEGTGPVELPSVDSALLRITQEALNNVVAHSNASRFDVVLDIGESGLSLAIEDNGAGFDAADLPEPTWESGYGLVSMKQRAQLINADLDISSTAGSGTKVTLTLPIEVETENVR